MKSRGITLISLVITIIVLIVLASVAISLSLGKNGIFNRAKWAKEKYEVAQIKETVEIGILDSQLQRETLNEELTIEGALQDLIENKIFDSIDKQEQLGYIGEYEVKLKYNEENKVVIEYIQKATGVRATYTLDPIGYTNIPKVNILFKVQGKVKSVITPKGLKVYPKNEVVGIDHEVTANGNYKFIIEKEDGSIVEKEVVVDTIDTLPPKDFEITAEATSIGDLMITSNVEDDESETSAKSGIAKIEYYVKLTTESEYTKYETNEIKGLSTGTYNVYAVAYDRAGNNPKQSKNIAQVEIEEWIEIWNEEDLIQIKEDVLKGIKRNYILMNDIELTQEWELIGDNINTFEGKFEGNYHNITKLNINDNDANSQGLFEYIGYEGKVSNLTLEGSIIHTTTGNTYLGMIAGYNKGIIENVKVNGVIEGRDYCIGGLVGCNEGEIVGCSSSVDVTGDNALGSLAGENVYKGIVRKSMASGKVTGGDNSGGLIGSNCNGGIIENSYSTGNVTGRGHVGGLVGLNRGKITNVYTISKVSATMSAGGLIGWNEKSNAINAYWSPEESNIEIDANTTTTKVEKAEDMKKQETYVGFDFKKIWIMKEYPELRCFADEE